MDALKIIEKYFEPKDGFVVPIINYVSSDGIWNLGYMHDERLTDPKIWHYNRFKGFDLVEEQKLKRNEVYGFLLAKHPDIDAKELIRDEVKRMLSEVIENIGFD